MYKGILLKELDDDGLPVSNELPIWAKVFFSLCNVAVIIGIIITFIFIFKM